MSRHQQPPKQQPSRTYYLEPKQGQGLLVKLKFKGLLQFTEKLLNQMFLPLDLKALGWKIKLEMSMEPSYVFKLHLQNKEFMIMPRVNVEEKLNSLLRHLNTVFGLLRFDSYYIVNIQTLADFIAKVIRQYSVPSSVYYEKYTEIFTYYTNQPPQPATVDGVAYKEWKQPLQTQPQQPQYQAAQAYSASRPVMPLTGYSQPQFQQSQLGEYQSVPEDYFSSLIGEQIYFTFKRHSKSLEGGGIPLGKSILDSGVVKSEQVGDQVTLVYFSDVKFATHFVGGLFKMGLGSRTKVGYKNVQGKGETNHVALTVADLNSLKSYLLDLANLVQIDPNLFEKIYDHCVDQKDKSSLFPTLSFKTSTEKLAEVIKVLYPQQGKKPNSKKQTAVRQALDIVNQNGAEKATNLAKVIDKCIGLFKTPEIDFKKYNSLDAVIAYAKKSPGEIRDALIKLEICKQEELTNHSSSQNSFAIFSSASGNRAYGDNPYADNIPQGQQTYNGY
ncbi:MAG: hypothetical protein K0U12_04750 [Gammaproteobacteria bacterium]|nr:hypothetical protein [Gammaproteobacteria bacterium]